MILTNYLIDVLVNLSCLGIALSALGCVAVLLSAFEESRKSKPNEEIIRCLVMG